jgi:hypothetical protein
VDALEECLSVEFEDEAAMPSSLESLEQVAESFFSDLFRVVQTPQISQFFEDSLDQTLEIFSGDRPSEPNPYSFWSSLLRSIDFSKPGDTSEYELICAAVLPEFRPLLFSQVSSSTKELPIRPCSSCRLGQPS